MIKASPFYWGSDTDPIKQPKETFESMFKMKLAIGLAALVTTLVVLAAPAMAEFEGNKQGQGPIVKFPATTTFTSTSTSPPVVCKSTAGVTPAGEYHIQVKTQTQQGKYFYQAQAEKGPHLQLKITKWGKCEAATLPVKVECNVQIEQISTTRGTGSAYPPGCVVVAGSCIIEVWANAANRELSEVKLENVGTNLDIESNVKGLSSVANKACEELKIKGGQGTGTFVTEGGALELEGVKAS